MESDKIFFKYVIAFIKCKDKVLLVLRNKNPWKSYWNGIGGHINEGETARSAIQREIMEETQINLNTALDVFFGGIVTWNADVEGVDNKHTLYGMDARKEYV